MKTTARNQFAGVVKALDLGPVSATVTIALKSGDEIVATMTADAARRLKLKKGKEALALVKASAIVLVSDFAGWRLSARNQLAGTVSRIERGAVSALVALTLPDQPYATLQAKVPVDVVVPQPVLPAVTVTPDASFPPTVAVPVIETVRVTPTKLRDADCCTFEKACEEGVNVTLAADAATVPLQPAAKVHA